MRFRALGLAGSLVLLMFVFASCRPPESSAPLHQEAYVWRRAHTGAVADALRAHAASFEQLVVLAAEVSWSAEGQPRIVRVPLNTEALKSAPSLGFAIRINAFSGSFAPNSVSTRALAELATSLLTNARAAGLRVTELQLDFDSPEKRLADYRLWLSALRPRVAPVRLTFTALPSWLKHSGDFSALAASSDSFVLQVHSLERPKSADDAVTLCDPEAAHRSIRLAARFNRPFRVALPTYGYQLAFNPAGRFFALSAEGPTPRWPAGTIVRELAADPAAIANLVSQIKLRHPESLTGIIWYRLPVSGDRLNWAWPTLASVMRGETPVARPSIEATTTGDGLIEYVAVNRGDATFTGTLSATVTWRGAAYVASDVLPPFALSAESATTQTLSTRTLRLAPGARQSAGWLRLNQAPLSLHVSPSS